MSEKIKLDSVALLGFTAPKLGSKRKAESKGPPPKKAKTPSRGPPKKAKKPSRAGWKSGMTKKEEAAVKRDLTSLHTDMANRTGKKLHGRFGAPPFSVIQARQSYWVDGNVKWEEAGIKTPTGSSDSFFCARLAEVLLRWFCTEGGVVLDPFCGSSTCTRALVAGAFGLTYGYIYGDADSDEGADPAIREALRCRGFAGVPLRGDARQAVTLAKDGPCEHSDLLITCAPDVFGDDSLPVAFGDVQLLHSTARYRGYCAALSKVVASSIACLKQNRFAVWCTYDARDPSTGTLHPLVKDTVKYFAENGLELYNTLCFIPQARVGAGGGGGCALELRHLTILVFWKGPALPNHFVPLDASFAKQLCIDVGAAIESVKNGEDSG